MEFIYYKNFSQVLFKQGDLLIMAIGAVQMGVNQMAEGGIGLQQHISPSETSFLIEIIWTVAKKFRFVDQVISRCNLQSQVVLHQIVG